MSLSSNLAVVRERISAACLRAGRNPAEVTLLAVTKNHPAATVAEAVSLGVTLFGENRIQEAKAKVPACPSQARWHFIGHLQSNKAREAIHWFSMIESLDSLTLAVELQKQAEKQAKTMPVLAEVNVAGESSKFGWNPAQLLSELPQLNALSRLELHGLMTVAPYSTNPEKVRSVFRRLRELRDQCVDVLGAPLTVLSMGMSGDLEVAIEEGATLVRVGTALFGPRQSRLVNSATEGESSA
ncbi:MAG TPA: YggS family pyridoxal phosphate-dependent enzyme [Verrucomicrobiota bacterium]|nr:YggS family pyridoxal phosphate-dependent enzyme [Verrucomicrobiales bacterium]HRI15645.1 YggS family pyridoxal phosphate-dependent enzyme [Verrucomicrobiota bacterium]